MLKIYEVWSMENRNKKGVKRTIGDFIMCLLFSRHNRIT